MRARRLVVSRALLEPKRCLVRALSTASLLLALALPGCCFGAMAEGMALQGECDSVIGSANASTARLEAMPEPLAGVAEPTPEQVASSLEPLAVAYDQAAAELSAIPVTNSQLVVQRDALAALYREAAMTMRTQGQSMAAAMRVGDEAAIDRALAAGDALAPREDVIIGELNRVCQRQP
jgi:hypothetical protein